nr:EAL domain-containing protein [Sagittula salina]
MFLTVAAFMAVKADQNSDIRNMVQTNARLVSMAVESRLEEDFAVAGLFALQLQEATQVMSEAFSLNAASIFGYLEDLQALNWVGPDGVITATHPPRGNEAAHGLDLSTLEAPARTLDEARLTGTLRLTPPLTLAQGGKGFVGYLPVYHHGEIGGFINLVFRAEPLLDSIIRPQLGDDFIVAIADGPLSVHGNFSHASQQPFALVTSLMVAGRTWDLAIAPTKTALNDRFALFDEAVLIAGFILSCALAALVYVMGKGQEAIRDSEERFALAMKGASDGLFDRDLRTGDVYLSPVWFRMLGYEPDALPHSLDTVRELLHPDDREVLTERLDDLRENGPTNLEREFRMRHRDGSWISILSRAFVVFKDGKATRLVGTHVDITADRKREHALRRAAVTDHLTGLHNRRGLDEELATLAASLGKGERLAIFHLDLDRFKQVNDTEGHQAGDAALCHTASGLKELEAEFELMARVGGDEFLLLRCSGDSDADIAALAKLIARRVGQPLQLGDKSLRLGTSIGISFVEHGGDSDIERAVADADIALKHAKEDGRGRHAFFEPGMREEAVLRATMQEEIRIGLRGDEFSAYFQPQVDLRTRKIVGFEALARWHHPTRGTLSAGQFLQFVASSSVVKLIDRQVLHHACKALTLLQGTCKDLVTVSVNISTEQLSEPGAADEIYGEVLLAGAAPRQVRLEILETTLLGERSPKITENVRRLAEHGFQIELDDFGTGHTAISSLLNFPISRIKVDRSLIRHVDCDARLQTVVHTILELGENLGIDVLAEGIETQAEAAYLALNRCGSGQGYHIARPMPLHELKAWIVSRERQQPAPMAPVLIQSG